jgi:hypothetical protein
MAKDGRARVLDEGPAAREQGSDTMKPSLLVVLGLALPVVAGCRTDPAIPLLERELYRKDREINRLQWQIEDLQDMLNSGDMRAAPGDRDGGGRDYDRSPRREHNGANSPSVNVESLGPGTRKVPNSLMPKGKPGTSPAPEIRLNVPGDDGTPSPDRSSDDGPSLEVGPARVSSYRSSGTTAADLAASAVPFNPSGDSRRVASIEVDRAMTGGISSGDRSGDQGLLVVVEPRDRQGRPIDAPAEVNVALLDPALPGDMARVARWDFTTAETAGLFRRTNAGGAMHLAMAWPKDPPKHNKLHMFVRYTTADGRKVEVNQPVEIALPGDAPTRWTAAEPSRFDDDPPPLRSSSLSNAPPPRKSDPPPYTATRTSASRPERPVWSPERR